MMRGDLGGVQGAGAAERDEGEVARIDAALDGDHAERVDHVVVRELDDGVRGPSSRLDPERARRAGPTASRELDLQRDLAAAEVVRR